MLTCPPSRINLTAADLASFEKRWNARQSARRDAENVRLGQGAARPTKQSFVPAAANVGRQRADSCSSKATVCDAQDDDPSLQSNVASPAQRLDLPNLANRSLSPQSASRRTGHPSPKPQKTSHPAPTRSPTRPVPELDFPIYEDPPFVHAFVEARHFQHQNRTATPGLQHNRISRAQTAPDHPQIPTINQPPLDPGAPVFVPRTRFGSTASTSIDNSLGGVSLDGYMAPIERRQSTANLRLRSSFERNTQHSSRSTDGQTITSASSLSTASARYPELDARARRSRSFISADVDLPMSLVPMDATQGRRRSRNNDQNASLQRPLLGLDRYPALRPPVAFASRRNSGSQRQVVFPHRRSSRQHLIEYERSRRLHGQQNRPTHLAVPHDNGQRPVSPAVSTSSHSTPNLLQPPSAPYAHNRSSSLSPGRFNPQGLGNVPLRSPRTAKSALSESSSLMDEILLQRDSPLDRIVQMYSQYPTRPRSVGHSFGRPPGRQTRPSLLNGNPFGGEHDDFQERLDQVMAQQTGADLSPQQYQPKPGAEQDVQTPHRRQPTIEDPVALALALPSPEVPSSPALKSSPLLRSSPQIPSTPILRSGPSSPLPPSATRPTSSAAKSRHSPTSLTPSTQSLAAAVTPRVPVYNDSHPRAEQPQTPADITRSSRRGRSNTTSTYQSALSSVQPSPTLAPPERHPHRHTFPSTAAQQPQVTVGTTPVRVAAMEAASAMRRDGLMARLEQRSSNSSENDIEGNLDGLEEDRRVWMRRHEDGSLDVTPPREGRFERYLS